MSDPVQYCGNLAVFEPQLPLSEKECRYREVCIDFNTCVIYAMKLAREQKRRDRKRYER